jgi:hypothetical protein
MPADERDPKFYFLRDIENHLCRESLPEARESLGDWILRSEENAALTQAAEEDSRRIDELLHHRTLQRREERIAASPQESLLIQAIHQDKELVRRTEEEQQQLDKTLSQAAVFRKECDRRLAELSRRAQLLEGKKQAILRRITVKFYGYSDTRLELLRPYAKAFAREEVRRQFGQQIGDRMCPEMSPESRAAKRTAEIIKLGKRHGIDDERVANWISGGISLGAISAEILDELASRSAQPATAAETETPAPRTEGNNSGLYDRELAEVFRLGIRGRVDRDQITESIEKYWRPELTAAEFIAGVSGLRRLKVRTDKRSIVGEIFELFGEPDRAWEWKDAYVQRLLSELEQLAEGATLEAEAAPSSVPSMEEPIGDVQVDDGFENFDEMMKSWEDASSAAELVAGDITAATQELEPAATQNPPPDQPTPKSEPRIPYEIATARKDEVVRLYGLLKRLKGLPSVDKSEPALRIKFGDAFKPLWDAIDQSSTLTAKDRKLFFRDLTNAGERERYQFIADILGSTPDTVRGWRFPRKAKTKKPA